MDEKSQDNRLHLPSLSIKGFRGIDALTIERLGRVTICGVVAVVALAIPEGSLSSLSALRAKTR